MSKPILQHLASREVLATQGGHGYLSLKIVYQLSRMSHSLAGDVGGG